MCIHTYIKTFKVQKVKGSKFVRKSLLTEKRKVSEVWYTPVIPDTLKAEIRKIKVKDQTGQKC
jgi:hypothetical protein